MSRQIQIRRGTTTEHATFTGANGEVTFDTIAKTLRVHDGQTPGGIPLARHDEIPTTTGGGTVEMPANYDFVTEHGTTGNMWYRKYKSGWIEQGGYVDALTSTGLAITFPKAMTNANYTILTGTHMSASSGEFAYIRTAPTATGFTIKSGSTTTVTRAFWEIKGLAA